MEDPSEVDSLTSYQVTSYQAVFSTSSPPVTLTHLMFRVHNMTTCNVTMTHSHSSTVTVSDVKSETESISEKVATYITEGLVALWVITFWLLFLNA